MKGTVNDQKVSFLPKNRFKQMASVNVHKNEKGCKHFQFFLKTDSGVNRSLAVYICPPIDIHCGSVWNNQED